MEYLFGVTVGFCILGFVVLVVATYQIWSGYEDECNAEEVHCKPELCDHCSCEFDEPFEVDLGGEHG